MTTNSKSFDFAFRYELEPKFPLDFELDLEFNSEFAVDFVLKFELACKSLVGSALPSKFVQQLLPETPEMGHL